MHAVVLMFKLRITLTRLLGCVEKVICNIYFLLSVLFVPLVFLSKIVKFKKKNVFDFSELHNPAAAIADQHSL